MKRENIILFGFMGTGKTTVGRLLAERLGWTPVDMDAVIVERAGCPISQIFSEKGEAVFRRMERALVQELAGQTRQVIATGGGVVLDARNVRDFKAAGLTVCLRASADEILRRVASDSSRPLLAGDKRARIEKILGDREDKYAAMPVQVQTEGCTPDEVMQQILAAWQAFEA